MNTLRSSLSSRSSRVAFAPAKASKRVNARLNVQARSFASAMGIMGTKAGMMSYFTEDGLCVPATVIALESPNYVTQVKTVDTDGYNAVQIGYKEVAERKVKKPELGHLQKSGCPPVRHLKEFKLRDRSVVESYKPGQKLDVTQLFKEGDTVDCAGLTIGKGFQGTIKLWNHKRGNMTHGSKSHREHGSTGPATTPGRNFPGTRMAGRMGHVRRSNIGLKVLKIDSARNAIIIKGTVPGKPGNLIEVNPTKKGMFVAN